MHRGKTYISSGGQAIMLGATMHSILRFKDLKFDELLALIQ
jgi:hypothetical protein